MFCQENGEQKPRKGKEVEKARRPESRRRTERAEIALRARAALSCFSPHSSFDALLFRGRFRPASSRGWGDLSLNRRPEECEDRAEAVRLWEARESKRAAKRRSLSRPPPPPHRRRHSGAATQAPLPSDHRLSPYSKYDDRGEDASRKQKWGGRRREERLISLFDRFSRRRRSFSDDGFGHCLNREALSLAPSLSLSLFLSLPRRRRKWPARERDKGKEDHRPYLCAVLLDVALGPLEGVGPRGGALAAGLGGGGGAGGGPLLVAPALLQGSLRDRGRRHRVGVSFLLGVGAAKETRREEHL